MRSRSIKKKISFVLVGILFTGVFHAYSISSSRKIVNKFISNNDLSIIAQSGDYTLASDKESTFFLFSEDYINDKVDVYIEVEQVTRDEVAKVIRKADGAIKVIESNGYLVLNVWQFLGDWYFVKTPKGKYYNISYKIGSIPALIDDF